MSDPAFERQALEREWRDRLENSRIRLDFARNYVHEIESDLRSGAKVRADCEEEYRRALRAKLVAAEEYFKVLKMFTNLVVDGISPVEDTERPKAKGALGE
jgi:hypothetical protein